VNRRQLFAVSAASLIASAFLLAGGPAGAAPTFGTPVVVSGANDSEPGIDVATDGTIYVNAIPGLLIGGPPSPSHLWRSTNSGASWTQTPPGVRALMLGGGDFDVDVDKVTGALYTTDLWLGSSTVASSTDKGQTWIANPVSTLIQDRQWIATAGGGRVYHATHQLPTGVTVARSIDGGITFPLQSVAMHVVDRTGCICPPGTLVVQGVDVLNDRVGVIAATSSGGIVFARSINSAATFTVRPVQSAQTGVQTQSAFPVVADAGGGKLVAVWQETLASSSRVKVARSSDWGNTWTAATTVVSSGTSVYPWVTARGNKIGVSLFHTSASGIPDTVASTAAWHEKYVESADFGGTWSTLTTVDPVSVKSGPICTDGLNCSTDRELGDFQSLTMDSSGRAYLTWTRSINGSDDTEIRFARQT